MNKLVLFGAGKIGRSFIGQLFSRGGYEVVFVDINPLVIDALNRHREYKVVIKSEQGDELLWVKNVRGIHASEAEKITAELVSATLAAVSVGQRGLSQVIPLLARAIEQRHHTRRQPLDIILAENMRNAAEYVFTELQKIVSPAVPLDRMVGLVETSIGKMVPLMPPEEEQKDILQVFAEPYNTLILDKKGFKNPVPSVPGLAPKENIKAWVDRKSFIHNFGHAAVAYTGFLYNPDFKYLYEALQVKAIRDFVRTAMHEAAAILMKKYPGEFTREDLSDHIDDLILRFQNKALGDTIYRVGCDLKRKLSENDRVAGLLHEGIKYNMPFDNILFVLICGFCFRAKDSSGKMFLPDEEFLKETEQYGLEAMLKNHCGIHHPLIIEKALYFMKNLQKVFQEKIK